MVRRHRDLKKRKREEPVAQGTLFIRDLGFLGGKKEEEEEEGLEKKFIEWRKVLVEKMNGIEVNLEGVKYNLSVVLPVSDDFERLKKDWEEFYAFGHPREGRREADTMILRGVPSRWFAETRVSSKPSMLVAHTIFSTFGKIRLHSFRFFHVEYVYVCPNLCFFSYFMNVMLWEMRERVIYGLLIAALIWCFW